MFDFVTVWLFLATRAILSRCGHPLNQDNSLWAPNSLFLYSPLFSFSAGGTLWCDMMNQGGVSDTRTTLE
ncbi:hypothetical protein HanPI659440_Chr06g0244471 [Helianthus annuus]|nr:hypothetical protein HanPI659440_Chr06g0244471 [Helianthus annuus]